MDGGAGTACRRHCDPGDRLPDYSLALWHGFNVPLAMSIAGIVGGTLLYMALRRTLDLYAIQNRSPGKALFQWNLRALFTGTARMTDAVTNGNLQRMLMLLVLSAVVVALVPFLQGGTLPNWPAPTPMPVLGWMVWLLMMACALGSLFLYQQRLLAVLVLGGTGLAVSLTFVFVGAGSGTDAVAGGNGHAGADAAGDELSARALVA